MAALGELDVERHIKYWKRCQGHYLPAPYITSDSTRLTLACFIISSLDLLRSSSSSSSSPPLTAAERAAIRVWILGLQHPDGGFCGSATHAPVSSSLSSSSTSHPFASASPGDANLAATFFALLLLGLAADTDSDTVSDTGSDTGRSQAFAGVKRRQLLLWLQKLQRDEDGAMGQMLWRGVPVGGHDVRNSYMAAGIRWMLRGDVDVKRDEDGDGDGDGDRDRDRDGAWVEDIEVERLVAFIGQTQTYDGGMGETTSFHESHAGYTYCALAALRLLRQSGSEATDDKDKTDSTNLVDEAQLLKFLAHRQFIYHAEEEANRSEDDDDNFVQSQFEQLQLKDGEPMFVGCNGRWNKKADTCYFWWAGGALALLNKSSVLRWESARNYLTAITQHQIGGFSKTAGEPPDIYHSYLGLTALAAMGEPRLKRLDDALCCSAHVTACIARARDGLIAAERERARRARNWEKDGFW